MSKEVKDQEEVLTRFRQHYRAALDIDEHRKHKVPLIRLESIVGVLLMPFRALLPCDRVDVDERHYI